MYFMKHVEREYQPVTVERGEMQRRVSIVILAILVGGPPQTEKPQRLSINDNRWMWSDKTMSIAILLEYQFSKRNIWRLY